MSAMNTVAIVNDFRSKVSGDETRIKARMAELMRKTIRASVDVSVPDGMELTDHYELLRGTTRPAAVDLQIDPNTPIDDRLNAAAEMLFESYD